MKTRAVIYARVSSDDHCKGGLNLNGQIELCRSFAAQKGYLVVAELPEDERGISGALNNSPALLQVLEMAHNGEFEVLVVREIDRLARNLAKQLSIEQEFKTYGVSIDFALETYANSPEGNLHKYIKAVIAEYERLKIIERTVRGRQQKIKAGNVIVHGKPPYGYQLQEKSGKSELIIHPAEARIVKLIFQWYARGDENQPPLTSRQIAQRLSQIGIPVPKPGRRNANEWSPRTIQNILSNQSYLGIWHYGKYINKLGKRIANAEEKWLPVPIPPIISPDIWNAVKSARVTNLQNSSRNTQTHHLLEKRLRCSSCGSTLSTRSATSGAKKYHYYFCPTAQKVRSTIRICHHTTYYRTDLVDQAIWQWVRSYLADPQLLRTGLRELSQLREYNSAPILEKIEIKTHLLEESRQELQRIADLYIDGTFTKQELMLRSRKLQTKIATLSSELLELREQLEHWRTLTLNLDDTLKTCTEISIKLNEAQISFLQQRKIIDSLEVKATLLSNTSEQLANITHLLGTAQVSIPHHKNISKKGVQ